MANYLTTDTDLEAVADAIRNKGGTSADLEFPQGFVDAIDDIETGGEDYLAKRLTNTLTSYSNETITTIGGYSFCGCSRLTSLWLPKVQYAGADFLMNAGVTKLALPSLSMSLTSYIFMQAPLTHLDFTAQSSIAAQGLYITTLSVLVLRKQTLVTLANINAFGQTKFKSGGTGGTLYVPQALIADYQAATNWSTILSYENNQILPIEGSIYETQYVDGHPLLTT